MTVWIFTRVTKGKWSSKPACASEIHIKKKKQIRIGSLRVILHCLQRKRKPSPLPKIYIKKSNQPKPGLEMPSVNLLLRFMFCVVPGALPAIVHESPILLRNIRNTLKTGLEITGNRAMIPRPSWEAFNTHYAAFEQETVLSSPVSTAIHHACSACITARARLCSDRYFWLQVRC